MASDEGSEEIFNKIIEENNITESEETIARLKKVMFEKSKLFNSKKIEYETLAQNEIIKTFHVLLDVEEDFKQIHRSITSFNIGKTSSRNTSNSVFFNNNINDTLNSYEFEVNYEAIPEEMNFSEAITSLLTLIESRMH
jgi:hypothetical protein